ncbi:nitroreductase family deazaflavin-dependent oxidoreductase [Kitasatospora azatica]|uniref:nitroreductase family deazaflavin-dependent oxidoreductase n=1 Tax=Kitasatospora azatica TaxID=58347 RepID=UPI00068D984A|nr:nitroreductase family deazaflavin-dependent oxidoreductase [Kitasatospora azatica]
MPRRIAPAPAPTGLRRHLLRAPIRLYRWHLGWLLGARFLLLTHVGRVSGQPRHVVLEVVGRDAQTGAYHLASGFGPRSDWYRNIRQHAGVEVQVGRHRLSGYARPMTREQSGRAMAVYALRRPRAARRLMAFCGLEVDGTSQDYFLVGRDHIPFVAVHPAALGAPLSRGTQLAG